MTYAPTTFGPLLWHSGHLLASNYAKNMDSGKRTYYLSFFDSFGHLLPCSWCRFYYAEICKLMPLESFIDKENGVSWWFYHVHDLVNKKNQFRERLCLEKCVCENKKCRFIERSTQSSPSFASVQALYDNTNITKTLKFNQ